MSEEINNFVQPPILKRIKKKGRQSAFLYLSSNTQEHSNTMKVKALRNWLEYHQLVYFIIDKETTEFTSITDIITNIITDQDKKTLVIKRSQ